MRSFKSFLAVLAAMVACVVLAHPAAAKIAAQGTEESAAIRMVIERQLAAFQRDDGAEAFSYAAPAIQRRFQTPEIFMEMVRKGYAPVYRPQEIEFRDLRVRGNTIQQEVLFVGPDGEPVLALYSMQQQPDGRWRIAGVILLKAPDASV